MKIEKFKLQIGECVAEAEGAERRRLQNMT
jgi:hypothetical protein